jgi:glucans biosynthesis protein
MKKLLRWLRPTGPWILAWAAVASGAEAGFDFETLRARARDLAAQVPRPSQGEVPAWLRELSYDDLRRIEFDGRQSLWHGEGRAFQVQFLHPGFLFDRSVRVFQLDGGRVTAVPFRREYFHYRGTKSGELPATMGFAGFRLMYPLDGSGAAPAEVGSFAGASYFRFMGAGAAYGLSARGLALDTAAAGPEEFPRFTEFWLERPEAGARSMAVLALLESERVTGAYRFTIAPGETTIVDVRAALYFRRPAGVVGLAPLTSMFWRGENSPATVDDYRPEVHDSDGLLLHRGNGEWIWRPLVNPRQVRVATFADENPRGFGLLQRDRDFEHYQDLEAAYHRRPGLWVEPRGGWGRGGVRLVEIPTTTEFDDNMVAFWVPEAGPRTGEAMEFGYRLHWSGEGIAPPAGYVRSTRRGKSGVHEPGLERFVVDFAGAALAARGAEARIEPVVTVGAGARLHHVTAQWNPINRTWRVAFLIKPAGTATPVELRCFLREGAAARSETWSYLWQP